MIISACVYEYGAGETLTCGSGACAAAAVLMRQERVNRRVRVTQAGGDLEIQWSNATDDILMTGPAELAFEGQFPNVSLDPELGVLSGDGGRVITTRGDVFDG